MKPKTVPKLRFCNNLIVASNTPNLQRPCGNVASVALYLCADCWEDMVAKRIPVPTALLTPKERQVVALVLAGRVRKEMCRDLNLSRSTLQYHLQNVFRKLGVDGQQQLILFLQGGLPRRTNDLG